MKIIGVQAAGAEMERDIACDYSRKAEAYRNGAASVESVLTDLVGKVCSRLRVAKGRLVTDTDRGETLYAELSDGERWKVAIEIAADVVGEGGVFDCKQESWQSLDPLVRPEVAEHCRRRKVTVVTAECSADQEITAKEYR